MQTVKDILGREHPLPQVGDETETEFSVFTVTRVTPTMVYYSSRSKRTGTVHAHKQALRHWLGFARHGEFRPAVAA